MSEKAVLPRQSYQLWPRKGLSRDRLNTINFRPRPRDQYTCGARRGFWTDGRQHGSNRLSPGKRGNRTSSGVQARPPLLPWHTALGTTPNVASRRHPHAARGMLNSMVRVVRFGPPAPSFPGSGPDAWAAEHPGCAGDNLGRNAVQLCPALPFKSQANSPPFPPGTPGGMGHARELTPW